MSHGPNAFFYSLQDDALLSLNPLFCKGCTLLVDPDATGGEGVRISVQSADGSQVEGVVLSVAMRMTEVDRAENLRVGEKH